MVRAVGIEPTLCYCEPDFESGVHQFRHARSAGREFRRQKVCCRLAYWLRAVNRGRSAWMVHFGANARPPGNRPALRRAPSSRMADDEAGIDLSHQA